MKTVTVKLNGYNKGFCIYVYSKDAFLTDKKKKRLYFKNLEEAKLYAYKQYPNSYNYKLWIMFDKIEVSFDDVEYINGYYEYYDLEHNTLYLIEEINKELVTSIGYFVFEDGDNPESKNKISDEKYGEYYDTIISAFESIIYNDMNAEGLLTDNYGNLMLKMKNSAIKFHILCNSEIMDVNLIRKENKQRCIPFIKSMDKFKTFYLYSTGLMNYKLDTSIIKTIIENIVGYIAMNGCKDIKYVPVEFQGVIKIGEDKE